MPQMQALAGEKAFDAVLSTRQQIANKAASPHFSLHYLSHNKREIAPEVVALRLGFILAKKISKQASRRNLIRRIWKATLHEQLKNQAPTIEVDMVVRQKAAFDNQQFLSASSAPFKRQVKQEALALLKLWQGKAQAASDTLP